MAVTASETLNGVFSIRYFTCYNTLFMFFRFLDEDFLKRNSNGR